MRLSIWYRYQSKKNEANKKVSKKTKASTIKTDNK